MRIIAVCVAILSLLYWAWPISQTGGGAYLEVKALSSQHPRLAALSIGSLQLSRYKSAAPFLRFSPGTYDLTGSGFWPPRFCSFELRALRVTTVTLLFEGETVRCQCLTHSPASSATRPVCT